MAATFGDGDAALRIQETLIAVYAHRGRTAEWEAAARSAVRFARDAKDHPGRSRALHQVMLALESAGREEEAVGAAEELLRFQYMVIAAALEAERAADCRRLLEHALAAVAESERLLGERERWFVHMRREDVARVAISRGFDGISQEFDRRAPRPTGEASAVPPEGPRAEAAAWARTALERLWTTASSDPYAAEAQKAARRALALIPADLGPEEAEAWREVCEALARFATERLAACATARNEGRAARVIWSGRALPHVATTYDIAVRAYGRIGEPAAQVRLLTGLARECFESGDYKRAVSCQARVAAIAETVGDEAGQGEALSAMAHAHLLLEEHEKAVQFAERAVPLLTDANRPGAAGRALTTIANARYRLNRPAEALSAARNAVTLARSAADLQGRAAALLVLGLAQRETGSAEEATLSWRTALLLSRQVKDPYLTHQTEAFLRSVGYLTT
ncbi:tetratricopeptide repeat protein [Streptomyces sp. NPDC056527]|uniref:tetratricopeptide repeat protein n=1 Tax=Streptomyces sp. NPDC056527 TaxID=3345853 RepID=UPI0036A170F6